MARLARFILNEKTDWGFVDGDSGLRRGRQGHDGRCPK